MTLFRRLSSVLWLAVAVVAVTAGGIGWYAWWRPATTTGPTEVDPRLTYETPFRNVRPDVAYVGDDECAGCHVTHADTYRKHPMGRSVTPIARVAGRQRYGTDVRNPFDARGFLYLVERDGDRVHHKERIRDEAGALVSETVAEVHYAIGSGSHAYSYLTSRDGFIFQSPITWYTQKEFWGLSPGFEGRHERFRRGVVPACLFCHTNGVEPVEHSSYRYQDPLFRGHAAIGCERCHGPGSLHVARREAGEVVTGLDDTVVNPKHLAPALRDAVCEQCHLEGEIRIVRRGRGAFDYRPGLPLELFWAVFARPGHEGEDDRVVSHVEQMHASRCYKASAGRMGCVSCHDPHEQKPPDKRASWFRTKCLECHAEKGCSAPAAERKVHNDACAACHMPTSPSSDVGHVAITDHRVRRRPTPGSSAHPVSPPSGPQPLVPTHPPADDRDYGIALAEVARRSEAPHLARLALPRLETALAKFPDDVPAEEARAWCEWVAGRPHAAWSQYEALLARVPMREVALADAAKLAEELSRTDDARSLWSRAVAANPQAPSYRFHLAQAHAATGDWAAARAECEILLRTEPASVETRLLLVADHLEHRRGEAADAEFRRVLALRPEDPETIKKWFEPRRR